LSHHLFEHPDLRTGAETVVLTLAVVYTWEMIAWLSNWLAPDQRSVQVLLLGLMLGSLLMSSGIEAAFGERAWVFISGYLAVQLIRGLFAVVVFPVGTPHHRHFVNTLAWEIAF
jgi:low temperature requirement protein LtrA